MSRRLDRILMETRYCLKPQNVIGIKLDIHEFFAILYQKTDLADTVIVFRINPVFLKAPTGLIFLTFKGLTTFDTFFVQLYLHYHTNNK
ncbi:MAG: hypothetical protein EB170_00450 [Nitrosopumilaceae archaeon]|nr:hypothetical protein [Nitrosopumilaceae archaeon]NDF25901.1 hypothetical protein [Nitrososphaerota archaeon]NDF27841.1 hypothetical protein [Nitrosopumilaceae archaeon]